MANVLDELFSAHVESVPYSLTITDISPSEREPSVAYATGYLKYKQELVPTEFGGASLYLLNKFYRDDEFKIVANHGIPIMSWKPQWANQLILQNSSSGYYFRYQVMAKPYAGATFVPEISEGKDFPGFPQLRTAVLVAKIWTGVAVLVLGLPDRKE